MHTLRIGLWRSYFSQSWLERARASAEQCLTLAQHLQDPVSLQLAHMTLGSTLIHLGEWVSARVHLEQGIALYDPQQYRMRAFSRPNDPGVVCLSRGAWALWMLGYADQALTMGHKALSLARESSHASSLTFALFFSAVLHQCRREARRVQEQAEAMLALSPEHGFVQRIAGGVLLRGWALTQQGMVEEGITQIQEGLSAWLADGSELGKTQILARLAEAYEKVGRTEEGLRALAEAFAALDKNAERHYEAELYRLQGDLVLQQALQQQVPGTPPRAGHSEAETHFCRAIDVARRQHAKFQELRAVMSLSRLWQAQGKYTEARTMLQETYGWFTEGFDTADLQEAKALLEELGG